MATRGILLEIQGCTTAYTANETTSAPISYSQSKVEAITAISPSQNMGINPFEGTFDSGGISLSLNQTASILTSRKTSPVCFLDAALTAGAITITVDSTTGFPSSGYVWIGDECISYTGTTGTTFTGCIRGKIGTSAKAWGLTLGTTSARTRKVYGFNPFLIGRKAWLYWYDLKSPATKTTRFIGYIDGIDFGDNGYTLSLLNGSKKLQDSEVMGGRFATGIFQGMWHPGRQGWYSNIPSGRGRGNSIMILLDDQDYQFPVFSTETYIAGHVQIGNEIIRYVQSDYPAITTTIQTSGDDGARQYFETTGVEFYVGDYFETFTSSDELLAGFITQEGTPATYDYRYYHTAHDDPGSTKDIYTPLKQEVGVLKYQIAETPAEEHKIGDEVKEVRVLYDNHVDLVLKLILSKEGDGSNGVYDVYPEGWGIGIDVAEVDVASFEAIRDYATERRFVFTGPRKISEIISNLARATGCRIYWSTAGKLTVNANRDIYPDASGLSVDTITKTDLIAGSLPQWSNKQENIFNCWVWRGNAEAGGDFKDEVFFQVEESVERYGKRSLPDFDDGSLVFTRSAANMEVVAISTLLRYAYDCPILTIDVLFEESTTYNPGDFLAVTMPFLPDLTGNEGLSSEFYEVIEFSPSPSEGRTTLRLMRMPLSVNTGLIAPSAEVSSVASLNVTIKASSDSHYADATNGSWIGEQISSEDGKEDIDYFYEGQNITLWDLSTFTSTTPTSASATISAINYTTKVMTLSAVPAWLAAGDLIRCEEWSVAGSTEKGYFVALADESATPPDLGTGDDPFVWGL